MTPLESKYIYLRTEYTKSRNFYDFCQYSNFKRLWKKKKKIHATYPFFYSIFPCTHDERCAKFSRIFELPKRFRPHMTKYGSYYIVLIIMRKSVWRCATWRIVNRCIESNVRVEHNILCCDISFLVLFIPPLSPPLPSRNCVEAGPGENAAAFNPRTKSSMEKKKKAVNVFLTNEKLNGEELLGRS